MIQDKAYGPDVSRRPSSLDFFTHFIQLDIRDETGNDRSMIFSNETLAEAIRCFTRDDELNAQAMRILLCDIADALDHPKANIKLKISASKVGRPEFFAQRAEREARDTNITGAVWWELCTSMQMEAAVSVAMIQFRVSRQTVFSAVSREANKTARMDKMASKLPKLESTWSKETQIAYRKYRDWLDHYVTAKNK